MTEQAESFRMAPMDRTNKATTGVVLVMIVGAVATLVALLAGAAGPTGEARQALLMSLVIVSAAMAIVLGLMWGIYRPSRIEVSALGVQVFWPMWSMLIRLEDIQSICRADRKRTGRVYRAFGMGGLCGTFGLCRSKRLGFVSTYVTRRDGAVLIERVTGRPLLITPDRPDQFIAAVEAVTAGPAHEAG